MLHKFNMSNFPFEILPDWSTIPFGDLVTVGLLVVFVMFTLIEANAAKIDTPLKSRYRSYRANINLFLFNSTILSLAPVSSLIYLADKNAAHAILNIGLPYAWKVVLAFLMLDLIFYFWHKASHNFDFLWELHKIHHCDPNVNVSTSFRVHTLELFISVLIKVAFIISLGLDKMTVIIFEAISTFFVMFHHSNISMPGEHLLSRLFIVPSLHRVHHSKIREEHDQNYGSVLSIWDRLFGTLTKVEPKEIGIKGNPPLDFIGLLKFGFILNSQWSKPEPDLQPMIAEAAYYIALNQGFRNDHDLDDWLQAEQKIMDSEYHHKLAKKSFIHCLNDFKLPSFSLFPVKCAYGY